MAAANLRQENITSGVYVVGNTVLDNLKGTEFTYGNTILVTMHRRENHELMDQWFHQLETLAVKHPEYEFVIPLHPNPNVQQYRHILKKVKVITPVDHTQFIELPESFRWIDTNNNHIPSETEICPYGDGHSSEKICAILMEALNV